MKQADGSSDVCYNVQTAVDAGWPPGQARLKNEHALCSFFAPTRAENKMIVDYNVTNHCTDINLERNLGLCPMGVILYPVSYRKSKGAAIYSNRKACKNCPRRKKCKEYDRELQVKMQPENFSKEYNDKNLSVKQIVYLPDRTLLRKRKELVEHPFGTLKRGMDSAYFKLLA